ncbi:LLM class flavin-dependent oxidoreductase [Mesorhizobium sp. M4A.F.Ca.ET.029.04.2.1]|nr:LLM class flavin-dependent oxidoreductase [Mesorhizobium sp. M4A.F.Ca.ET.029.04.2.1]
MVHWLLQPLASNSEGDQPDRYDRTKEFLRLVRKLWTEEIVTYSGEHFKGEPIHPLATLWRRGAREGGREQNG